MAQNSKNIHVHLDPTDNTLKFSQIQIIEKVFSNIVLNYTVLYEMQKIEMLSVMNDPNFKTHT